MTDVFEQKAIRFADELHASEQGKQLIKDLISRWQLQGFVIGATGRPAHSPALWSIHHHDGYALAAKLRKAVRS